MIWSMFIRPGARRIGARSEPYGSAKVEIFDASGTLVSFAETATTNHVWVAGLAPDTEYTYRVTVNGEVWADGERRDWLAESDGQGLVRTGRRYENRFRTHPHPEESASLTFAVLGDFGTGVRKPSKPDKRQREVAAALDRAIDERGVRLIITTGDNIYAGKTFLGLPVGATGDEDDDWFFTFYQPYRYIINRIPVYPSVGNHDSSESEASDDREQLIDNFYLAERFSGEEAAGRASTQSGPLLPLPLRRRNRVHLHRHLAAVEPVLKAVFRTSQSHRVRGSIISRNGRCEEWAHLAHPVFAPPAVLRGPAPFQFPLDD